MTCEHCGRTDHSARAHADPAAALEAGDEALTRGEKTLAMFWYRVATKLARASARELRGIRA